MGRSRNHQHNRIKRIATIDSRMHVYIAYNNHKLLPQYRQYMAMVARSKLYFVDRLLDYNYKHPKKRKLGIAQLPFQL